MPIYRFRLEAQDGSGHFRQGTIEADSSFEARRVLEEREARNVAFQMDAKRIAELCRDHGAKSLDDLPAAAPIDATEEEKKAFRALPVRDRAHLNVHRQTEPYVLVALEEEV